MMKLTARVVCVGLSTIKDDTLILRSSLMLRMHGLFEKTSILTRN